MMKKYEMQINKDKLVSSKTALAMHELRIYIPSLFWYDKLGGLHTEKNGCYSPYYMCGCPTLLECLQYLKKELLISSRENRNVVIKWSPKEENISSITQRKRTSFLQHWKKP